MANESTKCTTRAKIKGKIIIINLASENKNSYQEIKDRIEYLGAGKYHSYDYVPATGNKKMHFWKWKTSSAVVPKT